MADSISEIYDTSWNVQKYLQQYYATPDILSDERGNFSFARRHFRRSGHRFGRAIEVGCGPTLHHAMLLAPHVETLDMADYVPANLREVRRSLDGEPGAHDWSVFLGGMLEPGGPSAEALWAMLRDRVGNLRQMNILEAQQGSYDLVASYYCSECVAGTQDEWLRCLSTLADLTRPGGVLLLGVARHCNAYHVCGEVFPAKYVDESEFAEALPRLGFDPEKIVVEIVPVPELNEQGFSSICCVWAEKLG